MKSGNEVGLDDEDYSIIATFRGTWNIKRTVRV